MDLITGGTGFLGAHLTARLLQKGKKLRLLVRKTSSMQELDFVLTYYFGQQASEMMKKIEFFEGDINDIFSLDKAAEGIENVYHCAAFVSFDPKDKELMMTINTEGTTNLVNVLLTKNIRKLCYASSVAAIGRKKESREIDENTQWQNSKLNTSYAVSKHEAELEVWRAFNEGLDSVIVNPSVLVGVGDINKGSCKLYSLVKKGLRFYTKGVTGFVDVEDVAEIMINLTESEIKGERYLLNSENISFQYFFNSIAKNFNVRPPDIYANFLMRKTVVLSDTIFSAIRGRKRMYSPDFARVAGSHSYYSNEKIIKETAHKFRTIEESTANACNYYKKTVYNR